MRIGVYSYLGWSGLKLENAAAAGEADGGNSNELVASCLDFMVAHVLTATKLAMHGRRQTVENVEHVEVVIEVPNSPVL
jgi:hypothetical protein